MAKIILGKNGRVVDPSKIKGGVKREDFKSEKEIKLFDAFNTVKNNGNEVLTADEIAFILKNLLGDDDKIDKKEAKEFLKKFDLKGVKKEDLFAFIEKLASQNNDVVASHNGKDGAFVVREHQGDSANQIITEEDQIGPDGKTKTTIKTTSNMDDAGHVKDSTSVLSNGDKIIKSYIGEDGNVVLEDLPTGEKIEILQSEIIVSADGTKSEKTEYDENGNKYMQTVTNGLTVEEFEFITNGEGKQVPIPVSKIENKGLPTETTTYYTVDKNGVVTKSIAQGNGKEVTILYEADGKTPKQITTLENSNLTRIVYNDDGTYIEHKQDNVTVSTDEDGSPKYSADNMISTTFNAEGNSLAQKVILGDKEYTVTYDGNGNTNVVVQFGENLDKIVDKFGCSKEALVALNGEDAFTTGAQIKIPGELNADAKVLQGRGSSAQEIRKQQRYEARVTTHAGSSPDKRETLKNYKIDPPMVLKNGSWAYKYKLDTAKNIAAYLYLEEGAKPGTVMESSLQARAAQIIKSNPDKFDKNGNLKTNGKSISQIPLNLPVNEALAAKWGGAIVRKADASTHYAELDNARDGHSLAMKAHAAIRGIGTDTDTLKNCLDKVNKDNVVGFWQGYQSVGESFVKAMRGESKIKGTKYESKYINTIKTALMDRCKELGLICNLNGISEKSSTEVIDAVFNRTVAYIRAIEVIPQSERAEAVKKMNAKFDRNGIAALRSAGVGNITDATNILDAQLKEDGMFADMYEGMKWMNNHSLSALFFGQNDQLDEKVKADIKIFQGKLNKVIQAYNKNQNVEEFQAAFKAEFGKNCDIVLLNQYIELSGRIDKAKPAADLEQMSRYFYGYKKMPENDLRQKFADILKENPDAFGKDFNVSNLSKQEMVAVVDNILANLTKQKGNHTATEYYDLCSARIGVAKNLFGAQGGKNDVVSRAISYAEDQQKGAQYVGMGVKLVAAIVAGAFTGGVGAAALATAGSSFALDALDKTYRGAVNGGEYMTGEEFKSALGEAVISGAMVFVGGKIYKFADGVDLSKLSKMSSLVKSADGTYQLTNLGKLIKGGMLVSADTGMGAGMELLTTGEVTAEGTLFNAAFSVGGNAVAARLAKPKPFKPNSKPKSPIDKATVGGTEITGGKFSDANFNGRGGVADQVAAELPTASADRAAQIYQEGQVHQSAARGQGRKIQQMVADETGFVQIGKEKIDIATADRATLKRARKAVEGWADGTRNKQKLLDDINLRLLDTDASLPTRGADVVKKLNSADAQNSQKILAAKQGLLAPNDANTLVNHIVNNLNSVEEVETFLAQLKQRVGGRTRVSKKGNEIFEWNQSNIGGVDQVKRVLDAANKKIRELNKQSAQVADRQPVVEPDPHQIVMDGAPNAPSPDGLLTPEFTTPKKPVNPVADKPAVGASKPVVTKQKPAREVKAEAPKVETPKAGAPKAESPKAEAPKAETPKAEAPKADASKADAKARDAIITSEDKLDMGQISNNINRARSLDALEKAQTWLDKMPNCQQKTNLQNQLNAKRAKLAAAAQEVATPLVRQESPAVKPTSDNVVVEPRNRDAVTLNDSELLGEIKRLNSTRKILNRKTGKFELYGNHKTRYDEVMAELSKRGLKYENGKLVKVSNSPVLESEPVLEAEIITDYSQMKPGTKLPKNEPVELTGNETLKLANYNLELDSPSIQARLRSMNDGDIVIIGRDPGVGGIKLFDVPKTVSEKHLQIQKFGNKFVVTDLSTNGTSIAKALPKINENELVRFVGNDGKEVNANYIRTSREARLYLEEAIDAGTYTSNIESYMSVMNDAHKISYHGVDGQHSWYNQVGQGSLEIQPGVIQTKGQLQNGRYLEACQIEEIAKIYGDPYRVSSQNFASSKVKLDGIPSEYQPQCIMTGGNYTHFYPAAESIKPYYFKEMYRTSKEVLALIESGAPERQIIAKIAEHYQYAANARPYGQINNSLFMNEVNTLLSRAGLKTIPHGMLDHAAQRLQPKAFKKYFIDQYYETSLPVKGSAVVKDPVLEVVPDNDVVVVNDDPVLEAVPDIVVSDSKQEVFNVEIDANGNGILLTDSQKQISNMIDQAVDISDLSGIEMEIVKMPEGDAKNFLIQKLNQKNKAELDQPVYVDIDANNGINPHEEYLQQQARLQKQQQQQFIDDMNNAALYEAYQDLYTPDEPFFGDM